MSVRARRVRAGCEVDRLDGPSFLLSTLLAMLISLCYCADAGISLSWNMRSNPVGCKIEKYQIYAYQEASTPAGSDPWKPVGEVNALPLPMECTLTQVRDLRAIFV